VLNESPQLIFEILCRLSRKSGHRIISTITLPRRPVTIATVLYLGLKSSYLGFSVAGRRVSTVSPQSVRMASAVYESETQENNCEDCRCCRRF
jgi:hypothetical protein